MSEWFRVSIRYGTAACVISCAGELDAMASERVGEAASLCLGRGCAVLMIDCGGVHFIDAAGIQRLLETVEECHGSGTGFILAPSDRVRKVAEALGVSERLGLRQYGAGGGKLVLEPIETAVSN